jgi:hypothetical protein
MYFLIGLGVYYVVPTKASGCLILPFNHRGHKGLHKGHRELVFP